MHVKKLQLCVCVVKIPKSWSESWRW